MAEGAAATAAGRVGAGRRRPLLSPAEAREAGWLSVDPRHRPPDARLATALPATWALPEGLLPWRRMGGVTVVLAADPERAATGLPALEAALGPVRIAHAPDAPLRAALGLWLGRPLARAAEERREPWRSVRGLSRDRLARGGALALLGLCGLLLLAPLVLAGALALLAALTLLLGAGLKLLAAAATLRRDRSDEGAEVVPARLPVITVIVPLYRERAVAGHLMARLAALDYPRDRLDLCLVLEDDDETTREALLGAELPPWVRVVEVPEGRCRTKPRALNFAMAFARGSIVGVYDAEDCPSPGQLRQVASLFARRGPEVACLQGALDYFNARRNWLARCFTLEYAAWFRVLLPGLARLGLVVPLGGTTLFLRREALEAVGGWDAHNVTEDCDLGIALARAGYRTEIAPFATLEEANARPWPWVRQRSRWLKGYALTWAVHMREPRALLRDLGPRRFLALQVLVGGTLLQFALAPLLWSFWLVPLGLPHPLAAVLPPGLLVALSILFLAAQALDISYAWLGARRAGRGRLALWAPALQAYFPMATLAVYRALWEACACPFRWDKTEHGLDAPPPPPLAPPRRLAVAARGGRA